MAVAGCNLVQELAKSSHRQVDHRGAREGVGDYTRSGDRMLKEPEAEVDGRLPVSHVLPPVERALLREVEQTKEWSQFVASLIDAAPHDSSFRSDHRWVEPTEDEHEIDQCNVLWS